MRYPVLLSLLGGITMISLLGDLSPAKACHFRTRRIGFGSASSSYGVYSPAPYERTTVKSQSSNAEEEESEPGVVQAAYTTTTTKAPAAVAPIRLSAPRVLPLSEMGNNNFPDH
jgi:hypothetical protein